MKLTILGNNGPYPRSGAACSGYLLSSESGNTQIIIDFGTGCLANLPAHAAYTDIDAVILTHLHYDHMSDMFPLRYAFQFNPPAHPVPVYAPAEPAPVRNLLNDTCFDFREMRDTVIGEMTVRFCPVRHPVPTYAVRVECDSRSFCFTGDSNTIDSLPGFAYSCDLLLADAGLSAQDWRESAPHLSALECGRLAKAAAASKLLLTHLNPRYREDTLVEEAKTEFENTVFSVIGETYRI